MSCAVDERSGCRSLTAAQLAHIFNWIWPSAAANNEKRNHKRMHEDYGYRGFGRRVEETLPRDCHINPFDFICVANNETTNAMLSKRLGRRACSSIKVSPCCARVL